MTRLNACEARASSAPSRENGEKNPHYANHPAFIWGAVLASHEQDALRAWLDVVEAHFPSSPAFVGSTRERLLRDGNAWLEPSGGS